MLREPLGKAPLLPLVSRSPSWLLSGCLVYLCDIPPVVWNLGLFPRYLSVVHFFNPSLGHHLPVFRIPSSLSTLALFVWSPGVLSLLLVLLPALMAILFLSH